MSVDAWVQPDAKCNDKPRHKHLEDPDVSTPQVLLKVVIQNTIAIDHLGRNEHTGLMDTRYEPGWGATTTTASGRLGSRTPQTIRLGSSFRGRKIEKPMFGGRASSGARTA